MASDLIMQLRKVKNKGSLIFHLFKQSIFCCKVFKIKTTFFANSTRMYRSRVTNQMSKTKVRHSPDLCESSIGGSSFRRRQTRTEFLRPFWRRSAPSRRRRYRRLSGLDKSSHTQEGSFGSTKMIKDKKTSIGMKHFKNLKQIY